MISTCSFINTNGRTQESKNTERNNIVIIIIKQSIAKENKDLDTMRGIGNRELNIGNQV